MSNSLSVFEKEFGLTVNEEGNVVVSSLKVSDYYKKEVPNIYGGFGEDQKVILAKTVSEIHNAELKTINQNINRHIKDGYFEEGIDFIDLKNGHSGLPLSEIGFSKRDISISKNIYLLSQQGYTLLLKLMNSELATRWIKTINC